VQAVTANFGLLLQDYSTAHKLSGIQIFNQILQLTGTILSMKLAMAITGYKTYRPCAQWTFIHCFWYTQPYKPDKRATTRNYAARELRHWSRFPTLNYNFAAIFTITAVNNQSIIGYTLHYHWFFVNKKHLQSLCQPIRSTEQRNTSPDTCNHTQHGHSVHHIHCGSAKRPES